MSIKKPYMIGLFALLFSVIPALGSQLKLEQTAKLFPIDIHHLLVMHQTKIKADEVVVVVMQSDTGELISVDSSLESKSYMSLNGIAQSSAFTKLYEPADGLSPILLTLAYDKLQKQHTQNSDLFHDLMAGKLGENSDIDGLREDVVHEKEFKERSIVQQTKTLTKDEFRNGLLKFGYGEETGLNKYENSRGYLHSIKVLGDPMTRAIAATGYGQSATLIQHVKAYNVLNNKGKIISPKLYGDKQKSSDAVEIIDEFTAEIMNSYLQGYASNSWKDRNTSDYSHLKIGYYDSLSVGYDHSLANCKSNGINTKVYNLMAVGFINDSKSRFTVGIAAFNPKVCVETNPSLLPLFKDIVQAMMD